MKNDFISVVNNDFCIGCGACAVSDDSIKIKMNQYGLYIPIFDEKVESDDKAQVCPFISVENETTLGEKYFSNLEGIQYQKQIGYYHRLYAGYVTEGDFRRNGSSGGMTTWILAELLKTNQIDAVIHVGQVEGDGLFSYVISETINDVRMRTKSQYYPTHFDDVLKQLDFSKRYAFVGIPCYIKAVRLLSEQNLALKKSIKFFIGIFCGHLKSAAFAESLALQQGIKPDELKSIDFRVKENTPSANLYKIKVESITGKVKVKENRELYGTDWGLGFFKPKACDWCDDIAGELADIVCGDAWLPQYSKDSRGTNVLVVRHPIIGNILKKAVEEGVIKLNDLSLDDLIKSQAANFRHRHEGLSVRIKNAERLNKWFPNKRIKSDSFVVGKDREKIYLLREELARLSHIYFHEAKGFNSFFWFKLKMFSVEYKYYHATGVLLRKIFRAIVMFFRLNRLFGKKYR